MSGALPDWHKEILDSSKELAQNPSFGKGDFPIEIEGKEFVILAKGSKGHDWILQNDDISISISQDWHAGEYMPEVMVTYRSAYLWREGLERCTENVSRYVSKLGQIVDEKVSRCDICIDIADAIPSLALTDRCIQGRMRRKSNFIGSAKASGQKETGYQMGTGSIVARVYDKVHEIGISDKQWMEKIWEKGGWYNDEAVTRIEFQLRREALKDFGVSSISSLIQTLPDIWHYATQKWFTIHNKIVSDSRHTRWPLSDFWQIVQSAVFMFGQRLGVLRSHQIRPRLKHLESMITGVAASMCALAATTENDFKQSKLAIIDSIQTAFNGPDFDAICRSRQFKFAIVS